jgi:hypothetical protein
MSEQRRGEEEKERMHDVCGRVYASKGHLKYIYLPVFYVCFRKQRFGPMLDRFP